MLIVQKLNKFYGKKQILDDVSFSIKQDTILSLVGKSGSGKTTLAMCIAGLIPIDSGDIILNGSNLKELNKKEENIVLRQNIQFIFQNAKGTLHPCKKIGKIFAESIKSMNKLTGQTDFCQFENVLKKVNLPASALNKKPSVFSGGECQRIALARALLVKPKLLIADEALSSSDVTTQAKILNLLKKIKQDGYSILFISHDISAAHYISDEIIVMDRGKIIENGRCDSVVKSPQQRITKRMVELSRSQLIRSK